LAVPVANRGINSPISELISRNKPYLRQPRPYPSTLRPSKKRKLESNPPFQHHSPLDHPRLTKHQSGEKKANRGSGRRLMAS
ncbi:unnamed protein product, partial [Arabidopsis halleri]